MPNLGNYVTACTCMYGEIKRHLSTSTETQDRAQILPIMNNGGFRVKMVTFKGSV